MTMGSILSVRALNIHFGSRSVIQNLDFEVNAGDNLAIIGPNGAGKTVLLKALLGLLPYEGEIRWSPSARLGYVPQKAAVAPTIIMVSALLFGLSLTRSTA